MEDSILTSVKSMLGIPEDESAFDSEIIMHINSVFADLNQLGVGPSDGYAIEDKADAWDDYIQGDLNLSPVKTYMKDKVKLMFDPPSSSFVLEAIQRRINETEWRLCNRTKNET